MNKNIFKTLLISFIVLFSALFINIDGVKADVDFESLDGYAQCSYEGRSTQNSNTNPSTDFYEVDIYVYKEKSGTKVGWGILKKAENIIDDQFNHSQTVALKKASFYNYEEIFYHADKKLFPHFYVNNQYKCKSDVYINPGGVLSITKPNHNKEHKGGSYIRLKLNQSNSKVVNEANANGQIIDRGVNEYISSEAITEFEQEKKERDALELYGNNDYLNILKWGQNAEEGNYSLDDAGSPCNSISDIAYLLNTILWIVDIIAIIILIIMTTVDLIRTITGSEEDNLKSAFKHLIVRIIVVFILLLLPIILGAIINIMNTETGTVQIGDDGKPFCDIGN